MPLPALAMVPAVPQAPAQSGFAQALNMLRSGWVRAYVGGLSAVSALSVLVLGLLVWLWSAGSIDLPAPVASLVSQVDTDRLSVNANSVLRLAEGVVVSVNPWFVVLIAAFVAVMAALWVRLVTAYFHRNSGEVVA